ncbi:MAG: 1-acyl-sn-glycerol-3-phosphate acyltransferase, partial [Chitinophagales bacterium]
AFSSKTLKRAFYFFHMLPIWRERDKAGNRNISNEPTFAACYELLSKNQMLCIYPEGDCINENHVRPLKKGITRIAFGAMEKYNWEPDIRIIPVGINYTGAEKFRQWKMINFGEPIAVADYKEAFLENPTLATSALKDDIEEGMRKVALHIPRSHYYHDIEYLVQMVARALILENNEPYNPVTKFYTEQQIIAKLEHMRMYAHEEMSDLVKSLHKYQKNLKHFRFRENTFDTFRQQWFVILIMAFYFLVMFPLFVFGTAVNIVPYKLIEKGVERKVKQRIFYSSMKFVAGLFIFPVWYILLFVTTWMVLGSVLSALIFLFAFPVCGLIAFHWYYDLKKWWSVMRFKWWQKRGDELFVQMLAQRNRILSVIRNYQPF